MRPSLLLIAVVIGATQVSAGNFPANFLWGTATAAYQIEGAYNQDGRFPSSWDTFAHTPGKTHNGDTGDVADDSYNQVDVDINLLRDLGVNSYRLSISWPRILPEGYGTVNALGVKHYSDLVDKLLDHNIIPFVTLYHWDVPQALEDIYGSFRNPQIITDFTAYADVMFQALGDRVKNWITFNEPHEVCWQGYGTGTMAPGRCDNRTWCNEGDSSTEPYTACHNLLLAHAQAANLYKTKYQASQKGIIGITLNCDYYIPYTTAQADIDAASRQYDFQLGWFADPLYTGDYPDTMRQYCGSRLPTFTAAQSQMLMGSHDFFGINHYTSLYVMNNPNPTGTAGWDVDRHVSTTYYNVDGIPIGPQADSTWLYVYPPGIEGVLKHIKESYNSPPIYVTENGVDVPNESSLPIDQALNDTFRVDYLQDYLTYASFAVNLDKVDLRGYFVWSLLDNFEWADGYTKRFGIHYVDYTSPQLTRYVKQSAKWYKNFIAQQTVK